MLINNEQRFQYVYFLLSGITASAILILVYISVRENNTILLKDDLKLIQKSINFTKPLLAWHYNNTWKYIGNSTLRHGIYSAYFDARTDIIDNIAVDQSHVPIGSVRIFAVLPSYFYDNINCIFRFDDFTLKESKAQYASTIPEENKKLFGSYTVMCPLRINRDTNTYRFPQAVALAYPSNRLSRLSPTFVQISYPRKIDQMLVKSRPAIALCVGTLPTKYADAMRIVEFVEMYRISGVSHFVFYHPGDISKEVLRIIDFYRSIGIAELLEWNLHSGQTQDVYFDGTVAQHNECIFRAMTVDNYRYAAIVDLDEFIIPLKHNTLADFLHQCDEGRTSAYIFRNVFYYKKDGNDMFSVPIHTRNRALITQTKVRRTVEIMPAYTRSKCVVNTRSVIEFGVHQMWRTADGYSENIVHPSVGMLFQYRDKCINCKTVLTVDYTARRFGSMIWDRVDEICLQVFMDKGGICPTG